MVIEPIPSEVIERARSKQGAGSSEAVLVAAGGGEPLRCCLTNAAAGEGLLLFNYEPPLPPSPYREKGAVFVHAVPCHPTIDPHCYPSEWRERPQVLRAYDARGWIRTAVVHDGTSPEAAIDAVLSDPDVVVVHSRNVAYGCYMFSVRRCEF